MVSNLANTPTHAEALVGGGEEGCWTEIGVGEEEATSTGSEDDAAVSKEPLGSRRGGKSLYSAAHPNRDAPRAALGGVR